MDYQLFGKLVAEEIEYLSSFDLSGEPELCKALWALYQLQEYIGRENENNSIIISRRIDVHTTAEGTETVV